MSNPCDGIRHCDTHQGFTMIESILLDASNRGMKDDFRDMWRGILMFEAPISVDGRCEVWNVLRWQISTQAESITPTCIFINPRDCEGPSLHRESEFIRPPQDAVLEAHEPWVEYHVGMLKLHIYTVANASWNAYDKHGYRCNGSSIPVEESVLSLTQIYNVSSSLF